MTAREPAHLPMVLPGQCMGFTDKAHQLPRGHSLPPHLEPIQVIYVMKVMVSQARLWLPGTSCADSAVLTATGSSPASATHWDRAVKELFLQSLSRGEAANNTEESVSLRKGPCLSWGPAVGTGLEGGGHRSSLSFPCLWLAFEKAKPRAHWTNSPAHTRAGLGAGTA